MAGGDRQYVVVKFLLRDGTANPYAVCGIATDITELKQAEELQARREQLVTRLDAGLLTRYDNIRRTRQGRAVSKVEQGSCQWCRVILTPSELQRVRTSTELQTCSNCGRILYYDR